MAKVNNVAEAVSWYGDEVVVEGNVLQGTLVDEFVDVEEGVTFSSDVDSCDCGEVNGIVFDGITKGMDS